MLKVYALDDLDVIGEITNYARLELVERDLAAGEWRLDVPVPDGGSLVADWQAADWPGIEVVDQATGWRFGGFLTRPATIRQGARQPVATFRGLDFQGWLQGWRVWPRPEDPDLSWKLVFGSGALSLTASAHNLAGPNFGAAARAERQMPNVTGIGSNDPDAGAGVPFHFNFQPILELFRSWFTGTAWTVRLRMIREGNDGAGALLFETPARPTTEALFAADTGTVGDVSTEETAARATRVLMLGTEDGVEAGSRYVADSLTPSTDWRTRYWETFRERPSLDQAPLDDEADQLLTELAAEATAEFGEIEVEGFGRDLDIGWLAQVRLNRTTVATLPIVASRLIVENGTPRRTISIGAERLTPTEVLADQVARLSARLRRLEGEGQRTA